MEFGDSFFQPVTGQAERELDKRLIVMFYAEEERDEAASAAKGEDVFRPVEFIKIFQPGGGDEVDRRVTDADRERFADRYEKFKKKQEQRAEGYPIEEWTGLHRSILNEYRKRGIDTVEQLANISDAQAHNMPMGFNTTRAKAVAFLNARKDSAALEKLASENDALKQKLEAFMARVEALEQTEKAAP